MDNSRREKYRLLAVKVLFLTLCLAPFVASITKASAHSYVAIALIMISIAALGRRNWSRAPSALFLAAGFSIFLLLLGAIPGWIALGATVITTRFVSPFLVTGFVHFPHVELLLAAGAASAAAIPGQSVNLVFSEALAIWVASSLMDAERLSVNAGVRRALGLVLVAVFLHQLANPPTADRPIWAINSNLDAALLAVVVAALGIPVLSVPLALYFRSRAALVMSLAISYRFSPKAWHFFLALIAPFVLFGGGLIAASEAPATSQGVERLGNPFDKAYAARTESVSSFINEIGRNLGLAFGLGDEEKRRYLSRNGLFPHNAIAYLCLDRGLLFSIAALTALFRAYVRRQEAGRRLILGYLLFSGTTDIGLGFDFLIALMSAACLADSHREQHVAKNA